MNKYIQQIVKFCVVGVSNTLIGYFVYSACIWFGAHYLVANAVGFIVSVLNAFYWSDRYVFKREPDERRNVWCVLIKTILAYASTGILLNSVLLWLFIDNIKMSEYVAPIIILAITVPTNFVLNKYWSYKTIKIEDEKDKHSCAML